LVADAANRAEQKIVDKLTTQLIPLSELTNFPIILVINNTDDPGTEFEDVEDALRGSKQVAIYFANDEPLHLELTRGDDAIGRQIVGGNKALSAVILYRRNLQDDGMTFRLVGQIFPNLTTERTIPEEIYDEIKFSLFD
jgi:hypothetical protein